jgi:hypothetical protein
MMNMNNAYSDNKPRIRRTFMDGQWKWCVTQKASNVRNDGRFAKALKFVMKLNNMVVFKERVTVVRGTDTVQFTHEGRNYSVTVRETGYAVGAYFNSAGEAELVIE